MIMAESKPNLVLFGAGMTGRGHVAQLAFESGWNITFIDKNAELVKLLNDAGKYTVHLISNHPRDIVISNYKAIHTENKNAVVKAILDSDMVITSVLPNNLADVAPLLAEGLRLRLAQIHKPLNIIAAENVNDGSSKLWSFTSKYLTPEEQEQYGKSFSFPNSMVARVVPRTSDPLLITAEDYNEWTADIFSRIGEPPELNGLEWVSNQEARLKRKLYLHNLGHAVCAYLGVIKGYKFIHESAQDEWVLSWVENAMTESGSAISKEFGFDEPGIKAYIQSLIDRLPKDALPDSIDRVVREPIRKLGLNDRLIGPLLLCEKYDLPVDGICLGISAVLASNINDTEGERLTNLINEKGIVEALSQVSNYTPNAESIRRIEMSYNLLKSSEAIYDVLGIGIVAVDDLLMVNNYPSADAKIRADKVVRQGGGLTGTALVAASKLGAKCAYGGILGQDDLSNWTVSELEREGVDCSLTIRSGDVKPYHSIIVVDTTHHTRAIIFSDDGVMPRPIETIDESFVSKAKVILIDQLGIDVMLHTALIAKKLGIPTVADIEREEHPQTRELLSQIDHLILSTSFAGKLTGSEDPAKQVEALYRNDRTCTAVTAGIKGCWYITKDKEIRHQPAFRVSTVDTTGCGDVFHGAYAAGITWGWDVPKCIQFASATAALKATKPGGRAGIPDKATVEKFLEENPATYG
jgi:sugar/nucleoside kinase (ribokinase family)/mannitol-1-phosphate/altronate dehydrogenase